jgi:hypothetical protein
MPRVAESTDEQRAAFAEALAIYLRRADMRPMDLVRALRDAGLPVHQASMSQWCAGQVEPQRRMVVEIERLLHLVPGLLSRYLGYLPLDAVSLAVSDVETALLADERLAPDQRQAMIATYRALLGLKPGA